MKVSEVSKGFGGFTLRSETFETSDTCETSVRSA